MLGKLIKYDLKYSFRIFFLIHAILLIVCTLGRFFLMDKLDFYGGPASLYSAIILFSVLFIFLFTAVGFGLSALLIVRFYRNLFTDEGYLTWTLPASPIQQLWSKIISGVIWCILDILICTLSLLILFTSKNVTTAYTHIASDITGKLGMPVSTFGLCLLIFVIFGAISSVIVIYLCIAIGQLFPGHRILCSIVMYFIITGIVEALTFALMFCADIAPGYNDITQSGQNMSHYMLTSFKLSTVISIFIIIVGYCILHYIMSKKINLP